MPIEIRRFGAGHRRPEGPPGTVGVSGQVIHSDARGILAELAFGTGARIEPHSNPNSTWFVVIEGGGWVQVGDERVRVAAGEAVHWPAGVIHAAGTEHARMRAIVVELAAGSPGMVAGLLEGSAVRVGDDADATAARGDGGLRDDPERPLGGYDPSEGEPI